MANEKQNKDNVNDKEQESKDGEQAPKSKKKLIILAIPVVLLVVGAVAFFLLKPSSDSEATSETETEAQATTEESTESTSDKTSTKEEQTASSSKEKSSLLDKITGKNKSDFGETINLKPFNINLGNPLENRYIRLEIALEYKGKEVQRREIEKRMPQLRDVIISVTSKRSREALLSTDGKDQLRKELLIMINRYMDNPIESVYITDILIN